MVLYVFHACVEDKEFEFSVDLDPNAIGGVGVALDKAVEEVSGVMLEQVQPVNCCACESRGATRLLHHPMIFGAVVPPRIEDIPQPVCDERSCAALAIAKFQQDMEEATLLQASAGGVPQHMIRPSVCFCCQRHALDKALLRCSRCKIARYCGTTCQRSDWAIHKKVCVPAAAQP